MHHRCIEDDTGEIGIVGAAAAAIVNAAYNATGIRVPDLPLTADKFLRLGSVVIGVP